MLGLESRVKPSCAKILAVATWTGGLTITYHCLGTSISASFSPTPLAKALLPKIKKEHLHQDLRLNQSVAAYSNRIATIGLKPLNRGCIRASAAQSASGWNHFIQPDFDTVRYACIWQ